MASSLPAVADCCAPSCPEETQVLVPGPAGADGAAGADGEAGVSAFTTLTSAFVMPAAAANVAIAVEDTSWMAVGEPIFIENAGTFEVISIGSATSVTVQNLGYSENVAAGASVASASIVTPSGWKGVDGADGSAAGSPMTTKGDLWTRDASSDVRLAVGADGLRPMADSAQTTGLRYAKVSLDDTNEVTGAAAVANGGTGATTAAAGFNNLSPLTTRGDILVRDATDSVRKALGATGTLLGSDGTDPQWAKLTVNNLNAQTGRAPVDLLLFREEQTSGTDGGTFTSGAWRTRALNIETLDTGNYASLAANQITLAAGTYRFRAVAVGYQCDNHQLRVQDITNGVALAYGATVRAGGAEEAQVASAVSGRFTIAGVTVIELQHRCETTKATTGMGKASSFGTIEVYSYIELEREAL